jgi:hypothetical protein
MSDKMERWDFTDNENGCDAMVLSEDGEFVEYEVAIRRIQEQERQLADRDAAWGRAIEWWWWNSGRWEGDSKDFHAAIRARLEAEKGD